jgi:hypothetical protein
MTKQNKKRLVDLAMNILKEKYPSFPDHAIPIPKYSDKTANGLTKCIKDFLNNSGWQAERINTTGRMIDDSKVVTDVVGFQRKVGTVKWIPGTGTKGSADLSATIAGRSVKIEVKIAKDRQSEYQKQYEQSITQAGGVYIIARDFDGFIQWYDNFIQTI